MNVSKIAMTKEEVNMKLIYDSQKALLRVSELHIANEPIEGRKVGENERINAEFVVQFFAPRSGEVSRSFS